jgi:hypothetical protein
MARRSAFLGVARLKRKLARIEPMMREEIPAAIEDTAKRMLSSMQTRVPVSVVPRRGYHLRDLLEMRVAKNELSGRVGLVRPVTQRLGFYWRWVAYGTVKMAGRDFITPALLEAEQNWPRRIRPAVDKALKRVIQSEPIDPGGA